MKKKIIALIDGSDYAESVCLFAAALWQAYGAPVELIHVLDDKTGSNGHDYSGAIRLGARSSLLKELADLDAARAKLLGDKGRAILEDGRQIVDNAGVTEITTRLRRGGVVDAIADIEGDSDVIIVGKRGEDADASDGYLGSNLERIVRAAHRPVFVVMPGFKPLKKALVAFDGGQSALKAVDYMISSALFADMAIDLVSVDGMDAHRQSALETATQRLRESGLKASSTTVKGQPEAVLSDMIDESDYDLLVMGAYGHSRIRNLIIGSTTTAMIRASTIPLLLIR